MSEDTDDLYRNDDHATVKQVQYIELLCNGGWLLETDFPSQTTFTQKRMLAKFEADKLIKLGKKRMRKR